MLIDTGAILTDGGQWQLVSDRLKEIHIPSTLVEVLQARLGQLKSLQNFRRYSVLQS